MTQALQEIDIKDSDFENIDGAVLDYVTGLKLKTQTNKGFVDVPVIWGSAERAFQRKHSAELHDNIGSLIYPVCIINRTSVTKDKEFKGTVWAAIPPVNDEKRGVITIARRIKSDKSHNFASATTKKTVGQYNYPKKNEKIVYETMTIPIPVYITVMYDIIFKTNYQEQMNDLVTPFITSPGGRNYILITKNNLRYETFIEQEIKMENNHNNLGDQEAKYISTVTLKVLGYLIGDGKNQETPRIVIRENPVEIKIPRERVIVGDIPEPPGTTYVGIK